MRILIVIISFITLYNILAPQHSQEQYEQAYLTQPLQPLTIDKGWNIKGLALQSPITEHQLQDQSIMFENPLLAHEHNLNITYNLADSNTTIKLAYQSISLSQEAMYQKQLTAYAIENVSQVQFENGLHYAMSIQDTVAILNQQQLKYQVQEHQIAIQTADKNIILHYENNALYAILVRSKDAYC